MSDIVNQGIATGNQAKIWEIGGVMMIWVLISTICAVLSSFFSARIGTAIARDMRNEMYEKVLSFSVSEIDKFSTASLITRTTNDIAQVQQTMVLVLSMLIRAPLMAVGAIFQAIETAPNMTWIIGLTIAIMLTIVIILMSIVIPKFKLFQKLIDKITLLTRENLTGLRVIRAFNNERIERTKFEEANNDITKLTLFINKVMSLISPLMMFIFNGTTLLCIWIGINLLETDPTYLGKMMAFMQYAIQVILSFIFLTVLFVILPRAGVSAARINEILGQKPKVTWKKKTSENQAKTPSIEFKNVSFAYDDAEDEVLSNISFVAKAGKTTAFVGSTGSGKSTLINLVPRFYDATKGDVLVNGVNVKEYAKDDLMEKLGYVPQRGVLFSGDIKSNIGFGRSEISEAEIEKAADISQSEEFIKKFDDRYNYHIAQGGTNVSGGQKQRLSIARAIAKNPEIYIFDDSFSALDMKTDAKLRKDLKTITKKSVVLIVAQRISTIKDADQIIVLDNGKVVGKGNHKELLNSCEVYREITKSQLSEKEYENELKLAKEKK